MPLYDYRCSYGHTVEVRHGIDETPKLVCYAGLLQPCGTPMERVILPPVPAPETEKSPRLRQPRPYDYGCHQCLFITTVEHFHDECPSVQCMGCGSREVTRRFSATDVVYKTNGFYTTDVHAGHKIKCQADIL